MRPNERLISNLNPRNWYSLMRRSMIVRDWYA